jgi:hypothetical protein
MVLKTIVRSPAPLVTITTTAKLLRSPVCPSVLNPLETTSTHCEYELLQEASEASASSSEEWEFSKRTRLGIPALRSWPLYTR